MINISLLDILCTVESGMGPTYDAELGGTSARIGCYKGRLPTHMWVAGAIYEDATHLH